MSESSSSRRVRQRTTSAASSGAAAARLARSQPNSTPFGVLTVPNSLADTSWPGPFATAQRILADRERALKKRDEAIFNEESESAIFLKDEYDIDLSQLMWEPAGRRFDFKPENQKPWEPLSARCIDIVAEVCSKDFESVEGLSNFPYELRRSLLIQLSKKIFITPEIAMKFAIRGSRSLSWPECSSITEDVLLDAFEKVSSTEITSPDVDIYSSPTSIAGGTITTIQLHNIGRAFGDKAAAFLINRASELEVLEVSGCYRLSDDSLARLLLASPQLRHLDLSANSLVGSKTLKALNFETLVSLSLDHATHITDADLFASLSHLGGGGDDDHCNQSSSTSFSSKSKSSKAIKSTLNGRRPVSLSLERLSVAGLIYISDTAADLLLRLFGPKLRHLSISGCVGLTDASLVSIRTHCCALRSLNISSLISVTTPALVGLFISHPGLLHAREGNKIQMSLDDIDDNAACEDENNNFDSNRGIENVKAVIPYAYSIGPIESVNLTGLTAITDDVVISMCVTGEGTLRTIVLNSCHQITSKAIVAIQRHCTRSLQMLDVSFCRNFSEASLGRLICSCAKFKLQTVSLWGCSQLTTDYFFAGISDIRLMVVGRMNV